jgi:signal transduction histidine kinase
LAGKGGKLEEKQKFYLDRAYKSTTRLINLVNDMLNVSRIESGRISIEVKKVDLEKLSEEAIGEVMPRATELGINVVLQKSPTPLFVIADQDKIKEVLINLVGNSIKFTPKGGTITVAFSQKDGMIVTSVTDTGVGIAPENMPKLFAKFGMVKASYVVNEQASSGTGLGLYICKSIIEIHGGQVWASSPGINKGATFSYSLKPYTQEEFGRLEAQFKGHGEVGIIHTAASK